MIRFAHVNIITDDWRKLETPESFSNRKGFGHITFRVENVEESLRHLLQHGGSKLGDLIETDIPDSGFLSFVNARDPDGNIIEIQNWNEQVKPEL